LGAPVQELTILSPSQIGSGFLAAYFGFFFWNKAILGGRKVACHYYPPYQSFHRHSSCLDPIRIAESIVTPENPSPIV
jgi:hypothetical protein